MPTNPNDIAKILNEMVKTLQELSDRELDSVESIFQGYKKTLENSKKIEESKKQLEDLEKKEVIKEKKENKEEEKRLAFKKTLSEVVGKTNSKIKNGLFDFSNMKKQMNPMTHIRNFVQEERQKFSSYFSFMKPKQSSEDFSRKEGENVHEVQLKLLKEIDSKIGRLTTNSSGGLFDSIFSSIQGLLGNLGGLGGLAEGAAAGAAGAGATGFLGKYAPKLFKGLGKAGKSVGGLAAKNPYAATAIVVGSLVAGGSLLGGDEEKTDTLQTRKVGGRVGRNDMYLVGENGPELFSPKQNGYIIPNNKLDRDSKEPEDDFRKVLKKSVVQIMSKMGTSFVDLDKEIIRKFTDVYSSIKNWIKGKVDNVKETLGNIPRNISGLFKGMFGGNVEEKKSTETVQPTPFKLPELRTVQSQVNVSPSPITNQLNFPQIKQEPIILQSTYNIPVSVPSLGNVQNDVTREFWLKQFVPKLADGIKKKPDPKNVRSNIVPAFYLGGS